MTLEADRVYYYKIVNVEGIRDEPVAEGVFNDGEIVLSMRGQYAPEFAFNIIKREIKQISDFFMYIRE